MGGRFLTITVLCLLGFGLGIAYTWRDISNDGAYFSQIEPAAGVAGGDSVGGSFTLTDHYGNQIDSSSFGDKYKVIFFGFTHCPDVCPAGLQKITQAMNALDKDIAENIQPLFITIDPERDTPDILQAYMGQYHDRMVGLTGTPEQIEEVVGQYKVYAARVDDDHSHHGYSMNHSSFIFFMTPDDQLITLFSHNDSAADVAQEISRLLSHS